MNRRNQRWPALLAAALALALGGVGVGITRAAERGTSLPNIQVSHDGFAAHAEPSLAVDPRDPRVLLGAAMLIQGHRVVVGTFRSVDGGQTWHDRGPLAMPAGTTYSGDVTVAFDAHGTGFVASLVQAVDGGGVYLWRTDDGGRSYRSPVAVMHGPFADHPGLAIDPASGQGGGDLYVAWRTRTGLAFSRSVDGGRHFSAPRIIVPGEDIYLPVVAAGSHGTVYVACEVIAGGVTGHVVVAGSADHGQHFGRPAVVGSMTDTLTPAPGINLPTGPSIATDPRAGTLYVAYVDGPVLVAQSRDGGRAWSAPVRITAASGPGQPVSFQPHVVVDDAGDVDVTYFALGHGRVAVILARSTTRGTGVWSSLQITDRPFDPALGVISAGKGNQGRYWWIGDYQGLAVGGGLIHPFWNDTRTGRLEIFTAAVPATAN